MKRFFNHFFTSLLLLATGFAILTGFSSCENFMKAQEVKQQVEDAIAYNNAKEFTLVVKSEPGLGTFLSEGEKKCKLGYTIDLQFTVTTEDYVFLGLEAVSTADNSVSRADCVEFTITNPEEAAKNNVYKITVKLVKEANDILIRPVFEKLENGDLEISDFVVADVYVDGNHGTYSPAKGTYNLIMGRTFEVSFIPDSDYEFVNWEIFDKNTGNKIPNGTYIEFDDVSAKSTFFTFKGVPKSLNLKLAIRANLAERPQILMTSPTYDPAGSWRDTTIQVVFDYDMDPDCLYYDDEKNEREILKQ